MSTRFVRYSLLGLVLLTYGLAWAKSEVRAEAEALKQLAEKISRLDVPGGQPYHLRLHFSLRVAGQQPFEGTLERLWAANDKSRTEIHLPGIDSVAVHLGDKLYEARNIRYTPLKLAQLGAMWEISPLPISDGERVKRVRDIKRDGKTLKCADWDVHGAGVQSICFAADTGVIVSANAGRATIEYSDYQPFGAKLYPRTMRRFENGQQVIEIHVDELAKSSVDNSFFTPPPNAEVWAACEGMIPPKAESTPDPEYPAGMSGKSAFVVLSVVVDSAGKPRDIYVLQTADKFDRAAIDAVKRWKFKPALCGNVPVSKKINVEVNFHGWR